MKEQRRKAAHRDKRTTDEIIEELLLVDTQENSPAGISTLTARGSKTEFEAGARLCQGATPKERVLGADILGQLGWQERLFQKEAVTILITMLTDEDPDTVVAAGIALGHRNDPCAISPALGLISHKNADIRYGAVMALSHHDDVRAIEGLIRLSSDSEHDIRNWATFALARQTDMDTPALRHALFTRLKDNKAEIRGEALIGLAERSDMRVLDALEKEISGDFHGAWAIEAAHSLGLSHLRPLLEGLKTRLPPEDKAAFGNELDQAIASCTH